MNEDYDTTIHELKELVRKFCEDRDWDQFHNAKDLSIALQIEVSELLELFRWKSIDEVEEIFKNTKTLEKVKEEIADILYFVLRLAQRYEIDLTDALRRKIKINEIRYPIDKFKGSNKKYNEV